MRRHFPSYSTRPGSALSAHSGALYTSRISVIQAAMPPPCAIVGQFEDPRRRQSSAAVPGSHRASPVCTLSHPPELRATETFAWLKRSIAGCPPRRFWPLHCSSPVSTSVVQAHCGPTRRSTPTPRRCSATGFIRATTCTFCNSHATATPDIRRSTCPTIRRHILRFSVCSS